MAIADLHPNNFFDVKLFGIGPPIIGSFLSVTGLGMEIEFESFTEGGSYYPRFYQKAVRPQILVLEQGVITTVDTAAMMMALVNQGMDIALAGAVILNDRFGMPIREWTIIGAHLTKYIGPTLNSNQTSLAVNRMEFLHNGCF